MNTSNSIMVIQNPGIVTGKKNGEIILKNTFKGLLIHKLRLSLLKKATLHFKTVTPVLCLWPGWTLV